MPCDTPLTASGLLAKHPMFSLLSEAAQRACCEAMRSVAYRTGETIFRAGDPGDAASFVVEGRVRILREGTAGGASLGTFRSGAFFAAHARDEQWLRTTGCRAAEESLVLHLPREFVRRLREEYPEIESYLDKTVEEAVLLETLGMSRLLAAVPGAELISALDVFQEAAFAAGQVIVEEGEPGDAMYVVRKGRLEVRQRSQAGRQGEQRRLGELLAGDYFGERALVLGTARSSTVVAAEDCECFKLDRAGFERLRDIAPSLPRQLSAKFAVYERTDQDAAQHADVWLVPIERPAGSAAIPVGGSSGIALGSGLPQQKLLDLLDLAEFTKGFPPGSVPSVLSCLRSGRFPRGARLPDDHLFIIRSGSVRRRGNRASQARLGKGDVFGALAAGGVVEAPRYVATDDLDVFSLDRRALDFLSETVPHWKAHMRRLCERESLAGENGEPIARVTPAAADPSETAGTEGITRRGTDPKSADRTSGGHRSGRRFPIRWIGQSAPNSCGLAALAMVLHARGMPGDYETLKRQCELLPRGLTLLQMHRLAESLGFTADVVETEIDELGPTDLPAIALWQESHYVVLFRVGKSMLVVGDPAVGLVKMSRSRLHQFWSGRLLLLGAVRRASTEIETVT